MSTWAKVAILLGLLLALMFGVSVIDKRGYNRAKAESTAALEKQRGEARATLAAETEKTRAVEAEFREFKLNREHIDADNQKTVADLQRRVRTLAGPTGRLRDPNAPGCGGGGGRTEAQAAASHGSGAENGAQAGGLLSAELSGLLQRLTAEADEINLAYASCRADAFQVRESPK
ncbi:hypothetical protein [uncultured Rhodoferax sp.]|uniref:hypothetical protein n=1 Tax=uncultured Rhodoferax sp. TaxID=223188 RepID=UPI0025D809CF|nr:hypothetical protein [uncultured Rhodoferax sp.]